MIRLEPAVPAAQLEAIRAPFLDQGATLIDTPVLQPLDLLLDVSGEAMRPRLFMVQADGIDAACLRPDFTIPVAQAHIESGASKGRYRYEGKAFRVAPWSRNGARIASSGADGTAGSSRIMAPPPGSPAPWR